MRQRDESAFGSRSLLRSHQNPAEDGGQLPRSLLVRSQRSES